VLAYRAAWLAGDVRPHALAQPGLSPGHIALKATGVLCLGHPIRPLTNFEQIAALSGKPAAPRSGTTAAPVRPH